jgi:hypothetical protein
MAGYHADSTGMDAKAIKDTAKAIEEAQAAATLTAAETLSSLAGSEKERPSGG